MNISYKWLRDYVDFDLSAEALAEALTSIGLETGSIEEVESIRGGLRGLVIGKVLTCVDHPDSDHLHITTVDLGDGNGPVQIVCGAPNVAAGQTVVVATIGTVLYAPDGKEFTIKKGRMRGQDSFGMICAEDEIGVGNSHDGIIVINEDVKPGTPAAEYYGLTSDHVLEVDLTPNRVDAASHYGVARDLSAWLCTHNRPAKAHKPEVESFKADRPDGGIGVEVLNTEACPRYCGLTIRGVKVTESPDWLKERLTAIGQRPINNIVDITNYILHGIGQPLHCFDLSQINDDKVSVKTVAEGTAFVTLDGVEHKLSERDLMICGANGPMCIAGVFGGLNSGVTEATTDIFLESAYFNPTWVRKTARRHGLSTDASFRYERGTDPNICLYAIKLAALLVKELAGGEICGDPVDISPQPIAPYPVTLSYKGLDALVGKNIPQETVDSILESLEIKITGRPSTDEVNLEVPTYRVDVRRPCDVIEDVLRIYGYNNVVAGDQLHASLSYQTPTDAADDMLRTISEQLTATGFNEILNNSLSSISYYDSLNRWPADKCVKLLNPLSSDLSVMRQTLLFGGLESIAHNINRKNSDLKFYESGNVYFFNPAEESTAERPLTPFSEESHLALWITGNITDGNWARGAQLSTFFDLKATVANVIARLGLNPREISLSVAEADEVMENQMTISTRSGKQLGMMGVVAQPLLRKMGIKQPVYFAELNWKALVALALKRNAEFTPLPRTMPVRRDLALLLDTAVTMEMVEQTVRSAEKRLLKNIELFDVYEGKNLPAGKKSYAIAITLQDDEKTLQDKQIDAVMQKITQSLEKRLGASLR
ncbi:MAG: phenylalanine--tRNA ligase subunit beta [Muribaculaceae bacterium]|nr:phenylalanine--tRNA ligase subunit beta [Muribaculaceae bacterium]